MAVRYREGRARPWQSYWNNPFTGKRECANFATKEEAEKNDSLIKHRLRFERESFRPEEPEEQEPEPVWTLEACYLEYLREKQFTQKGINWQMDAMRLPLHRLGAMPIGDITRQHCQAVLDEMSARSIKAASVRNYMSEK